MVPAEVVVAVEQVVKRLRPWIGPGRPLRRYRHQARLYAIESTSQGDQMVESSNVDLTEEMPTMMMNQAAFNANIKSLQTADQMTQSLLDIKA